MQNDFIVKKHNADDKIIALAGNPNVGKSTLFNALTGLRQHTGNWPGKTVSNARGVREYRGREYIFVDVPGSYSLRAASEEERTAAEFICSGIPDAVAVVCGASCLERNLNLVLQICEVTENVIVCVNLMDEAKQKGIEIDCNRLSEKLGIPVVPMTARNGEGIDNFLEQLETLVRRGGHLKVHVKYPEIIEKAVSLSGEKGYKALEILEEYDENNEGVKYLVENAVNKEKLNDIITKAVADTAQEIVKGVVKSDSDNDKRDRRLDRIFTGKFMSFPIMAALLAIVFWITIEGANVPSQLLNSLLFGFEDNVFDMLIALHLPVQLVNMLVYGMYRVLAWVVSVMLPPMAIFFPLFTILEDSGYLPRVAFNMDKCFKKCHACGKQALTMCMVFGCNAAGVTGCRIIDSERERLVAIITNSFVPCNGRFPILIAIITIFFAAERGTFTAVGILCLLIILGVAMTLLISWILTKTVLKGLSSALVLELPPYRMPKIGDVVVRSLFDRTIFVLGRAVKAAAPAGIIIWLMANIKFGNGTVLTAFSGFLDAPARLMGLDGVILTAFILGLPANEIVIPIMIMAYMNTGVLTEMTSLSELGALLAANGWTWVTAVSMLLFALIHWPCATTLLTIKKETSGMKWTLLSLFVPTVTGIIICILFSNIANLFI